MPKNDPRRPPPAPAGTPSRAARPLPERPVRREVVAADARPQADRAPLSRVDHVLFLPRGTLRAVDPARAPDAGRRPRAVADLQQALHDARRRDGVLLPDPVDPGGARQLPDPDDDRGPGSRLSEAE